MSRIALAALLIVIYRYSLSPEKSRDYIALEQKAIQIYLEHGCLGVEIYRDPHNPRKWMEINKFHDEKHHKEVIAAVEKDSRINVLFDEFLKLFDKGDPPTKDMYLRML
jgi:quinol monooxygenase YgiN